jgi:hypothetical protein
MVCPYSISYVYVMDMQKNAAICILPFGSHIVKHSEILDILDPEKLS